MMSLASAALIIGALLLVTYGLNQSEPPAVIAASQVSGSPIPSQDSAGALGLGGIAFVAAGAVISRFARRLASVEARRIMLRDTRQPVLYLRSFGDDSLKLWTATLGRPSLIERFTPRRFDAFEEVLVRYLSRRGPVIALNPPGTKLAPLGAARQTIDSADWQSAVGHWMEQSSLIVFVAPPGQVTQGLLWELAAVSANGYWNKALIVVPPIPPEQLHQRWQKLLDARPTFEPFILPLSAEDPGALVLAFSNNDWTVITADGRTEWSYGAALTLALDDSPPAQPSGSPRRDTQPTTGRRLLKPSIAALAVILAAAAGAGGWYAARSTSASSTTATTSATRSSKPPTEAAPTTSITAPLPSPSARRAAPVSRLVALAPAAAQYPHAGAIQTVIGEYFLGIDHHDYPEYLATRSTGQALTFHQFETGFRSTVDSNVVVTSLTTAPDGRPEAAVTFTSRQQPQDGPSGESCTNWQVKMFFDDNAGTYTIGAPPANYAASYQPCP